MINIACIPGYVRPTDTVEIQPTTCLSHWQLIKVKDQIGSFSRHLIGRAELIGRVSSDIVSINIVKLEATTKSGRVYILDRPGRDGDAVWLLDLWLKANQCTQHSDQTKALLRFRAGRMKVLQ